YAAVTLTPVAADLSLSKRLESRTESADGTTATATFTLTLKNDGPSNATGVEVMEFFAGEMTFVSASGAFNPATSTWTVGTLAPGEEVTLSITVSAPAEGALFNLAEVSAVNETDPDSEPLDGQGDDFAGAALNRGGFEVPPLAADLSVTKTVDQAQPLVGEQVTYTITVSNAGPFTTAGVAVTDVLPEGVTFVSASASTDGAGCAPCTYDADTSLWTIDKLVDGETATLMIVVEVTAEGEIENTARITSHHLPDPDSDIAIDNADEDDVASVVITVGSGKATSVVRSGGEGIPETYEMSQNYPNPFNPQTTIPFGVPQTGHVVVEVYNLLGQRVALLMDEELAAGRHEVIWQALDQPTGMYLVRMVAGETTLTKCVTLVK
ncbi:MAG TPA: T9SS type A sorting domain-containing protein, partial [Rhodothermales bacterium]|nr:T9SS type A sorting domain-containing protein [Rhodothermales bacterium]